MAPILGATDAAAQRLPPMAPVLNHVQDTRAFQSGVSYFDCVSLTDSPRRPESIFFLSVPEPVSMLGLRVVTCLSPQTSPGRGDAASERYVEKCKSGCSIAPASVVIAALRDSATDAWAVVSPVDSVAGAFSGMPYLQFQFSQLPAGIYRLTIRYKEESAVAGAVCIQAASMLQKRRLRMAENLRQLRESGE